MTALLPSEPAVPHVPSRDAVSLLLVDDDPKNLTALESILESPEHRLTKARNASEALTALMNTSFAAIVMDVQMPEMNGIELARLIKQRRKTQHIPIILLTAHYRENEDVVQGYDVGAVDYLTKPVHPAVLRSKVGVFVDLFRKTRALAEVNRTMECEIVERKTAEDRFRVVVEAAPSAMLVFTVEGCIELVNSQAERLFGMGRDSLMFQLISDLVSPSVLPGPGATEAVGPQEIMVRRKDGAQVPAEASFTPIHSAEGSRWLASIVDIAERKRSEESLRRANAELAAKNLALEKQAEERNLRIKAESARAEAEAANAAKDRFLAMLSHELRTPLSPVLHAVTLLNEDTGCTPEVRDLLLTIRRNVLLEARLIDDLLDLARVRNGKLQMDFQSTDAHQLLHHALEICSPEIASHGLEVRLELNAAVHGLRADPARIQQIFWNLINNSIKHTPSGGSITILTSNEVNGALRIQVTDTGCGIARDKLTRIFDAFEQGASTEASKGLGLGLAISKALAEFHGGTITAHSDGPGKGAVFTVTLPAANVSAVPEGETQRGEASPGAPPLRVLVVDDHHDTVAALSTLLIRRGYDVRSAESVASALETARSYVFDVLVTDLGLPDGSGVELFESLRKRHGNRNIEGVAVSGFGMDDDIARCERAGFSAHLTKPVEINKLQRCLASLTPKTAR